MTTKTTDFKLTTTRMIEDLHNRYVVIPPIGQLWGFNPDQKVDLKILQIKPHPTDDGIVVVAAKIESTAIVQTPSTPSSPKTESAITPGKIGNSPTPASLAPTPVTVHLSGVAKFQYELIADEWYLLDVTSVNLRAIQK